MKTPAPFVMGVDYDFGSTTDGQFYAQCLFPRCRTAKVKETKGQVLQAIGDHLRVKHKYPMTTIELPGGDYEGQRGHRSDSLQS